jgi:DNA-binding transcriptional ArsR family regulator
MATTTADRTADDSVSLAFAALADPTRRDLLTRLAGGEMTLSELAGAYAMSLQAVSKHLAVLERAGLVSRGRDAQRRPVRLEPAAIAPVAEWLEQYRRAAEDRYQRLDALLASLPPDDAAPSRRPRRQHPAPADQRSPS